MQPYATATGTKSTLEALSSAGWGMLLTPDSRAPGRIRFAQERGMPIAIDNGAFASWTRGEDWNAKQRDRFVSLVEDHGRDARWVVAPDIVAGGLESLERSEEWIPWLLERTELVLLPVQDGMTLDDVAPIISRYGGRVGLFLGGSTDWKWNTAAAWGELARSWRVPFHVARVNSQRRIRQAGTVGATSWDGTGPVQFPSMLPRLERGHRQAALELLAPAPACCARPDVRVDEYGAACVECGAELEAGAYALGADEGEGAAPWAELRRARGNGEQLALFASEGWRPLRLGESYGGGRWYTGGHESLDEGYLLMVRSPEDPTRTPRPKGGRLDRSPHLTVNKRSLADLEAEILGHLGADSYPKTLNRIGVELWDKTADITGHTKIVKALLGLVDRGEIAWGVWSAPGHDDDGAAVYFVKNDHRAPRVPSVWVEAPSL